MKKLLILLLFSMVFISCNEQMRNDTAYLESKTESGFVSEDASVDEVYKNDTHSNGNVKPIKRKLIQTANLKAEVNDYRKTRLLISKAIQNSGAYVFSENESQSDYRINNDIVIKISSQNFDSFIDSLSRLIPTFSVKEISTQDVTEEYIDIQTRVETKKRFEARYIEILKTAETVEDLMKVQGDIRIIREEIEAKEGRLRLLNDRISMSTVSLNIFQVKELMKKEDPGFQFFKRIGKGFINGWEGILSVVISITYAWPVWLIAIGFLLFIRKRVFRKESKWFQKMKK